MMLIPKCERVSFNGAWQVGLWCHCSNIQYFENAHQPEHFTNISSDKLIVTLEQLNKVVQADFPLIPTQKPGILIDG